MSAQVRVSFMIARGEYGYRHTVVPWYKPLAASRIVKCSQRVAFHRREAGLAVGAPFCLEGHIFIPLGRISVPV